MKGYLVDTNVLSESRKPNCDPNVALFLKSQPSVRLFTSVVNLAEISIGCESLPAGPKRLDVEAWLRDTVRPWFQSRLLPIDERTVIIWRTIVEEQRKRRYTGSEPDTLIAAIAIQCDLLVVTRDWTPFAEAGASTLQPWTRTFRAPSRPQVDLIELSNPQLLSGLHTQGQP